MKITVEKGSFIYPVCGREPYQLKTDVEFELIPDDFAEGCGLYRAKLAGVEVTVEQIEVTVEQTDVCTIGGELPCTMNS